MCGAVRGRCGRGGRGWWRAAGCAPASRPARVAPTGGRTVGARGYLVCMADYYLVMQAKGPGWDHARRRREQVGWDEHAAFMDALAAEGVVVIGGPVGEGDGDDTLLVVDLPSEAAVRQRLAIDPWAESVLLIKSIRPWSVWLRGRGLAKHNLGVSI